ncbi:unnamed protein product [Mytilus coruscus]|uniref:Uncharacterized protein n=1 Tax=Mytilus coruscus TaxID=42192 RepID=A0A6J8BP50_MYTCO|nr:unnamed protein product [Mytilus coruscus]
MSNKERENFYRGSILIVDNTNTSFVDLLELHLSRMTGSLLDLQSWKCLFNLPELPCPQHRMLHSELVCTVSASRGIDIRHLGDQLTKLLIEQCCPLRQTIEKLILIRNKVQGHAIKGRISDADYGGYKLDITSGIMEIAKVLLILRRCESYFLSNSLKILDYIRLNMIWKFMNKIKLDTKSLLFYRFDLSNERRVAALKMLSCTVLTSDLITSNCILAKALEVNDTSLVELIFKRDGSKINVPLALYNACARGAVSIVKWIFSNFPHT